MENVYLILVIILFVLAIFDLVVGVSNDAVNFVNSAVGAKAAPFKVIMAVATLGVFIGATFSSGMMEIARKSMFHPEMFFFEEVMIILLAVMITDVILLDLFNAFGMPTSTTVSIVFELLGAAVGVALIKVANNPEVPMSEYINSAKSLAIIAGILISVVISFTAGAIIQYITRAIFSFNYEKRFKYLGSLWGGFAITVTTYFLLVKGADGSSFMTDEVKAWIKENSNTIFLFSFIGWTVILQVCHWLFKINILKFTILVGTFALAMAFAGNDLVNFIGVPIAGLDSYLHYLNTPGARPDTLLMSFLSEPAQTETYILLAAGLVMVITLFTSKKARRVIKTEVDLGRQSEGEERFGSSFFARSLVRGSLSLSKSVSKFVPAVIKNYLDKQFEQPDRDMAAVKKGAPAFDLLRASVNLVIASILIASATSLKLPLSTTYVTFMVAMGSSLSDRAWDRDSAVYRITGVLSVIGGWFFTAFSAFTVTFLVAIALSYGGLWVLFGMLALVIFILSKSHLLNKSQDSEQIIDNEAEFEEIDGFIVSEKVQEQCKLNVTDVLTNVSEYYARTLKAFEREDRKLLKDTAKQVNALSLRSKKMRSNIYKTVRRLQEENIDSGLYYVQVLDYLRETAQCLTFITNPCWDHLNNNHKPFTDEQFADFRSLQLRVKNIIDDSVEMIESGDFTEIEKVLKAQSVILEQIRNLRKTQLKRIKKEKSGTKVSMLYLGVLHETQSMMLHLVNLVKANRDFAAYLK